MDEKLRFAEWIASEAKKIDSDGCTFVSELFHDCCSAHDLAYYYGKDPRSAYRQYRALPEDPGYWLLADPITRGAVDKRFRSCIQQKAPLKRFSPLAWLRWVGVRAGGWKPWGTYRNAA